ASFLACQYEVGARVMGRNVARFVSSFKCTSVVTCEVHVDELPISDETASGQRLLTFMAKEFEREATKRGAIAEIIGYVMVMAAGPKVTKRVRPSGPIMIPRVRGPGRWVRVNESMSARARAYQERITRHTSKEAYEVGGVRFDGYRRGVLIEAKGPGYAKFIKDGKFMRYFSGRHRLFEQANRQRGAAGNHPIEWHIAEQELAEMLRRVFRRRNITGIRVIHTP
ncbi:Tox-REase-5 domain-containing protein, partial [Haliangium sp.]|uniref:Tox-REase-5 domain-containing protein n=1 Tax=Haliangium sp. TaxID=2663208 RepID=UPI003D0A68A3